MSYKEYIIADLLSRCGRFFDAVINSLAAVSATLIFLLMLGISINVTGRYLGHPILGTEEVSEYFLLWLTFLGTTWVLKRGKHISIDILISKLDTKTQAALKIVFSLAAAAIFFFIAYYGTLSCLDYIHRNVWLPQILRPNKGVVWAIIPIGSFLLAIQFLRNVYGYSRSLLGR